MNAMVTAPPLVVPSLSAMRLALRVQAQLAPESAADRRAVLLGLVGAEFGDDIRADLAALLALQDGVAGLCGGGR